MTTFNTDEIRSGLSHFGKEYDKEQLINWLEQALDHIDQLEEELKHCLNLDNHNNIVNDKNKDIAELEQQLKAKDNEIEKIKNRLINGVIFGELNIK